MPLPAARRERQIINASEDDMSGYDLDGKVSNVIERLQDIIKTYGPEVTLDWDPNHWESYDSSPSPRYWIKRSRPETDEEMTKRITDEEAIYIQYEERERNQYEALKRKFGD